MWSMPWTNSMNKHALYVRRMVWVHLQGQQRLVVNDPVEQTREGGCSLRRIGQWPCDNNRWVIVCLVGPSQALTKHIVCHCHQNMASQRNTKIRDCDSNMCSCLIKWSKSTCLQDTLRKKLTNFHWARAIVHVLKEMQYHSEVCCDEGEL